METWYSAALESTTGAVRAKEAGCDDSLGWIGAPVGEELVFRCLGYGALRPWTRPVAALLTAFLFALVHLNATATLLYVWIALCCTVVYEKTGRFAAPMIVHAANNGLAVAVSL